MSSTFIIHFIAGLLKGHQGIAVDILKCRVREGRKSLVNDVILLKIGEKNQSCLTSLRGTIPWIRHWV